MTDESVDKWSLKIETRSTQVAVRDGFFNASNQKDVFKALECVGRNGGASADEPAFDYDADPYLFDRMSWCYFPGNGVYSVARSVGVNSVDCCFQKRTIRELPVYVNEYPPQLY